jgi:hydroxymethylpyrimidine pyrophosphatase-like HAD family hydrolase
MNDEQMLRNSKNSYAMGNAEDMVKTFAKETIDTNDNDGIYKKVIEIYKK